MDRTLLKTALFLTPLFLPIPIIGGLFGFTGAMIGLVISFALCLYVILNVDRIILRIYKARPALPGELTDLREKTWSLSHSAGITMPSIYVTELPLPGSFVVGKNPNQTTLVIPQRLMSLLKSEEFDALLAHNIVQIDNSIRLRTLVALISGISIMFASAVRWGAVFTGFGDYNDPAPKLFGLFITGFVAPPAATMIDLVTEKDYDARAAALCKNHDALISAVVRLENNNVTGHPSLGFLCLVDPKK
jgi:heat shock protein HtpX